VPPPFLLEVPHNRRRSSLFSLPSCLNLLDQAPFSNCWRYLLSWLFIHDPSTAFSCPFPFLPLLSPSLVPGDRPLWLTSPRVFFPLWLRPSGICNPSNALPCASLPIFSSAGRPPERGDHSCMRVFTALLPAGRCFSPPTPFSGRGSFSVSSPPYSPFPPPLNVGDGFPLPPTPFLPASFFFQAKSFLFTFFVER